MGVLFKVGMLITGQHQLRIRLWISSGHLYLKSWYHQIVFFFVFLSGQWSKNILFNITKGIEKEQITITKQLEQGNVCYF